MYLFKEISGIQQFIRRFRTKTGSVGFVPTMGALHRGHLSLVEASVSQCDLTVVSIFVNPTQFNDPKDLEKYPRPLSSDLRQLLAYDAWPLVVFLPSAEEIYPDDAEFFPEISFGHLDKVLEGHFRPGHFEGVVRVVKRLLDIVIPDDLFMGQKDYQQALLIKHMIKTLGLPVNMEVCPIVREENGLAMSSRNMRLEHSTRRKAGVIHEALSWIRSNFGQMDQNALLSRAHAKISRAGFRPEYLEIVDRETLLPVPETETERKCIVCCAVWAGDIRLIDNMLLE